MMEDDLINSGGGVGGGDDDIDDDDTDSSMSSSSFDSGDDSDDDDQQKKKSEGGDNEDDPEDDEEDPVIRAISKAKEKKESNHPPDLALEGGIIPSTLCFHPVADMIVFGGYGGEVVLYGYSNTGNRKLAECRLHNQDDIEEEEEPSSSSAVRALTFSHDGSNLIIAFSEQSLEFYQVKVEGEGDDATAVLKLTRRIGDGMPAPPSSIHVIDERLVAVGDDDGNVQIWDMKDKDARSSIRLGEDAISSMTTNNGDDENNTATTLICTSEEGAIYSVRVNRSGRSVKLLVESEIYKYEFNTSCLFKQGRKLAVGDGNGDVYVFNWGEFGKHSDVVTGVGRGEGINAMIPITERIILFGGEDGVIRAYHLFPVKYLGVVGRVGGGGSVDRMDVCNDGHLVASLGGGEGSVVKFWNVKYFEGVTVGCSGGKKKGSGVVVTTTTDTATTTSKSSSKKEDKNKKSMKSSGARLDLNNHNLPSSSNQNVKDFFSGLMD